MDTKRRRIYWTQIYAANLILPFLLAHSLVSRLGWIGVFLAVVSCWLAGLYFCGRSRFVTRSIVIGGILVGFSQFCPILHMIAGSAAIAITVGLGYAHDPEQPIDVITSIFGGFLATSITGGLLITVTLGTGSLLNLMCEGRGKPTANPLLDPELDR